MSQPEITIYGRPEFHIKLTREEVDVLVQLASVHYDWACKNLVRPTGLLYRWASSFQYDENLKELDCVATFRELDLLTKVLELRSSGMNADCSPVAAVANDLDAGFRNALITANAYSPQWVKVVL